MFFDFLKKKKERIESPDVSGPPEEDELEKFAPAAARREASAAARTDMRREAERRAAPARETTPGFIPPEYRDVEEAPLPSYEPLTGLRREGETDREPGGTPERRPEGGAAKTEDYVHKDKIELIISKLDTINARLRYIEEKLRK
ncbi:MAG: hypothetical protein ISS95_00760 [Candidatus Aenigmarchaeota archaeon]|nr:hypothetical protein [Candidatus Aenigmarchaeota archaeon]